MESFNAKLFFAQTAPQLKDTSYAWGPKMTPLLHFIRYLH